MKKGIKLFSLLLCLTLLFGIMAGASASEVDYGESVEVLEDFKVTFDSDLVEQQIAEAAEAQQSENDNPSTSTLAYPVYDYAACRRVTAYPLVRRIETGTRHYWTSVYAVSNFSVQNSASVTCRISPENTARLNQLALSKYEALDDGYTYELCGWYVVTNMEFHALNRMLYAQWTHSANCFSPTKTVKENIPSTGTLTIEGSYEIDPNRTTYQFSGWSGAYYRILPNGTTSGITIGAGVGVNSSLA